MSEAGQSVGAFGQLRRRDLGVVLDQLAEVGVSSCIGSVHI